MCSVTRSRFIALRLWGFFDFGVSWSSDVFAFGGQAWGVRVSTLNLKP